MTSRFLLTCAKPFPAVFAAALPCLALANPAFIDRAGDLPVAHEYAGGWEHFVGGGVAAFDCDRSGLPSLFVAGGENPARLLVNATEAPGAPVRFRLGEIEPITGVTGAYRLDVDGDGVMDLAVLRVGENLLLRGLGDCRFADAGKAWGFHGGASWSTAFAATWEAGAEWPTLAIGNYVDRADPAGPFMACDANEVHRPNMKAGGRGFVAPIRLEPGYCALSMLVSDWQRTGRRDLRISNDRHYYVRDGHEEMWRLDRMRPLREADGWARVSLWGMGIASRDIDGNGLPDVMLTSMGDQLVQLNEGGGRMRNAPHGLGTYATTPWFGDDGRPSTGWHPDWADFDNDGLTDLFIAKGNVDQMPSNAMRDPNNLRMQQPDGTFVEKADVAGVATTHRSRGAAVVDMNGDGRLDIVVVNRRAGLEVWENATAGTGNWLRVVPRMDGPNSHAVGAWVEVRTDAGTQVQELTVGGGHVSGHATGLHFGLGSADAAKMRVIWPDGATSDWVRVGAGRAMQVWPAGTGLRIGE